MNEIIIYVMTGFLVLGGFDKLRGNKWGYGEKFEEGFMAMGALALAMVGIISLAPVLGNVLTPIVGPIYEFLGAHPAMFAGTLLANDMGGYPLAQAMAGSNEAAAVFSGLILGAMLGPTIVFNIPVALGIIEKDDLPFLARGVLIGLVTIPVGAFVGGIAAGFGVAFVVANLVPVIIVAGLIATGLKLAPNKMIRGFEIFGKFVVGLITVALVAAAVEALTGVVVIPGMAPIGEGIEVIGAIAIVLAGAFPMVHAITTFGKKPLLKIGQALGMSEVAAAGLVATLANSIATFSILKDMDNRGKIINVAFLVSASFVFGDHLGYTAAVNSDVISAVVLGKLVGGVTALALAVFMTRDMATKKDALEKHDPAATLKKADAIA